MRVTFNGFPVQFDSQLVEESVLQAAEGARPAETEKFRRERDAIYEIEITDVRESSFRELDSRWFVRFGVADALVASLREHSSLANRISGVYVLPAWSARDEGADLHAAKGRSTDGTPLPAVVIHVRPKVLVDPEALRLLLQHELLHVTDMLEPDFGYEPALPEVQGGPMLQRLVQDRYRVLWNTTVDGRLAAQELLPKQRVKLRREEFLATFKMLGAEAQQHFDRFFTDPRPRHADLVSFAVRPPGGDGKNGLHCPLCNLPVSTLHPHPGGLHPRIVLAIHEDFPQWEHEMGICLQCADLYDARSPQ
jgi:hypothetical protein